MKPALKKGGKAAKRPRDVVGVFCGIPKSRLAESQILQFERLLSVADQTSQAYFDLKSAEKKRRTQWWNDSTVSREVPAFTWID